MGGTIFRHNELRDLFADLMKKVGLDVDIEPHMQPLDNATIINSTCTEDDARLDIFAKKILSSCFERFFYDVKIFDL